MLDDIASGEGDLIRRLDSNTRGGVGDQARLFNVFAEKLL